MDYKGLPDGSLYTPVKNVCEGFAHEAFHTYFLPESRQRDSDARTQDLEGMQRRSSGRPVNASSCGSWMPSSTERSEDLFLRRMFSLNRLTISFKKQVWREICIGVIFCTHPLWLPRHSTGCTLRRLTFSVDITTAVSHSIDRLHETHTRSARVRKG